MRYPTRLGLLFTVLLGLLLPASASAQILVFETTLRGDLPESDHAAFREALAAGLALDGRAPVRDEAATRALLGDGAACTEAACAQAAGEATPAQVAVYADVYAEAEIYDFSLRVFNLSTGEVLHTQSGDCTFCPAAEAIDSLRFTAQSALGSVTPLPTATGGSAVAAVDPVTADEPATAPAAGVASPAVVATVPRATPRATSPPADFNRKAVGGVLIGAGAAALVGGVLLLFLDGEATCATGPYSSCPEVRETTAGGAALTALGALGAGAGLGVLLSGSRGSESESSTQVGVGRAGSGWGVRLDARF